MNSKKVKIVLKVFRSEPFIQLWENSENVMTSSKSRKSSFSFTAVKSFNFPGGLESYNAAVKLESSGLVNTWLHDFRGAYTLIQAVQVATT